MLDFDHFLLLRVYFWAAFDTVSRDRLLLNSGAPFQIFLGGGRGPPKGPLSIGLSINVFLVVFQTILSKMKNQSTFFS